MTNADHIRRMTDEDLAKLILQFDPCDYCDDQGAYDCQCPTGCLKSTMEWLIKAVEYEREDSQTASNDGLFTASQVYNLLIEQGQCDPRFKLGEIIKYSPSDVLKILLNERTNKDAKSIKI